MLFRIVRNYQFHNVKIYNFKSNSISNTKLLKITAHYVKLCQPNHECSSTPLGNPLNKNEAKSTVTKVTEDWSDVAAKWYKQYQDFVGISEILEAQEKVSMLTNQLLDVQIKRRQLQRDVEEIHQQLLATHQRITKSELYSEDHYSLFEKARQLNGNLKTLQSQFIQTEEEERSLFTQLSTAIKYCHEKERTQSEQSKYWSILISVISATLAALITSVNNWVRIKEIKDHATLLNKEVLEKTKNIESMFANGLTDNKSFEGDSLSQEDLLQSIQETIREQISQLYPPPQAEAEETLHDYQEVSYFKIAGSMFSGALIGIVITYNFLASS